MARRVGEEEKRKQNGEGGGQVGIAETAYREKTNGINKQHDFLIISYTVLSPFPR